MQSDDFKNKIPKIDEIWMKNFSILEKSISTQNEIIKLQQENEKRLKKELEESRKPIFFFNIN